MQRYQFTATKIQLTGPVPSELDVRYVAFRPLIKTFYTKSGIRGRLLNRALKHQYRTIYSYDRKTEYGISDHSQLARKFLDITSWGQGGRVYTYVITLDGEWRFTETGEEFGIQMLSKHTMHSCVSIYVAFAGEFFVRAKKRPHHRHQPHRNHSGTAHSHEHEPEERSGHEGHVDDFELVIDNDSGTYRPDKELLPSLQKFLERNLEGLAISARHCYDEDHMTEKKEHAKAKERRGRAKYKQPSSSRSSSSSEGSIDSSDEEELTSGKLGIGRRMRQRMMLELEEDDEVVVDPARKEGSSNWKGKEKDVLPAENGD